MTFNVKTLELDEFKALVTDSFISSFSKSSFENINILPDIKSIYERQKEIAQAIEYKDSHSFIQDDIDFYNLFYSIINNENSFNSISFNPTDFIIIKNFLIKLTLLKEDLSNKKYNYLLAYTENFSIYDNLIEIIAKSIDDKGNIKDDASFKLKEIRDGLKTYKNNIKKILSNIFNSSSSDKFIQDKVIVLRNGRYTIPCKTNFSQYIQGIIQDKSASGETLYIEPASCISINNSMQELIIAESEEIAKIIYLLISSLKSSLNSLKETISDYAYLIMILEIGRFYSDKDYTFGEKVNKVIMEEVHHPLLYLRKKEASIPIDFTIENMGSQIIITGPNTGGKTAGLKSIGLNHLISYCGLPVFGKNFKFMEFSSILADIGDNQSIIMDLSTFSSHMINIKNIIEKADSKTLILLDELGTGTEPREGACLAVAILKYLKNKGATIILTTHFSEVKNYALNNSNSYFYSVDFDYDNLTPRYKLIKDVMGKSDPIIIAEKLGFKEEIINIARKEISIYKSSLEVQIEDLNKIKAELDYKDKILALKEEELLKREEILKIDSKALEKKLSEKEINLLEETYSLLQKSKRLALEKEKFSKDEIEEYIKETSDKLSKAKKKQVQIKDIKVGDILFLDKYKAEVKVLEISGNNVSLLLNGMKIKMEKANIVGHKVEKKESKPVKLSSNVSKSNLKRELLLVGKRVEEALDLLEKFIDDLLLTSYDKAYIIHGRGSGKLRKAVHEYLRIHPKIYKYYLAENSEGGVAVTVIEIG